MKKWMILSLLVLGTAAYSQNFKKEIYDNGVLVKVFELSENSATMTAFHPNGVVKEKGSYVNGLPEGKWVTYNDQGQAISVGYFKNGVKEGTWTIQPGMGDLTYELVYENGVQTRADQYGPELNHAQQ